jgi:uncharacterized membrane protein
LCTTGFALVALHCTDNSWLLAHEGFSKRLSLSWLERKYDRSPRRLAMSMQFKSSRFAAVLAMAAALIPLRAVGGEIGKPVTAKGFTFINFDAGIAAGTAGSGSNANGISDKGHVVVTVINTDGSFSNFTGTPANTVPLSLGATAMVFGMNSSGAIVGTQDGAAFFIPAKGVAQALPSPAGATSAFGISDRGQVVGQYTNAQGQTPGFFLPNMKAQATTINAPSGPNVVNAQGINNFGLIVGFYVGTDGQDHGFIANTADIHNHVLIGTPVADPTIPAVAGEPGATFVFSQLLGVNDAGIVVGYYGDSTTSQHGFLYNTNTGKYTFIDDPKEAFSNGVEVTQITGIDDSGELTGFYSDANGAFHGFTACPPDAFCPNFPHDLP